MQWRDGACPLPLLTGPGWNPESLSIWGLGGALTSALEVGEEHFRVALGYTLMSLNLGGFGRLGQVFILSWGGERDGIWAVVTLVGQGVYAEIL